MASRYSSLAWTALLIAPATPLTAQNALEFDGINDQVVVNGASAAIAGSAELSLTCWVYPRNNVTSFPDLDGYAGFRNEIDADFYLLQLYNNNLEGRLRNSSGTVFTVTTTTGVTLNQWHHVGLTFDGSTMTIWIDGAAAASAPASGTITNTSANFSLGNINFNTQPFWFKGKLDEVALWRRALSAEEMQCLGAAPPDSGDSDLALYYDCDQGIAGGDNTGITTLTDGVGAFDGSLQGFALTGTASNFVQGTVFGTQISDQICPGGTYLFNDQTLTDPGVYTTTYSTGGLCDSTVVLTLTQTAVNIGVAQNMNTLIAQATGATFHWLDCTTGQTIPGATNQYYTTFVTGQFAVIVTQNGCVDTSACYNVTTIGIEERRMPTAKLWPQPVQDMLNIELAASLTNAEIRITDLTGRVVHRRRMTQLLRTSVDMSAFPSGLYFLEVDAMGMREAWRFIRE